MKEKEKLSLTIRYYYYYYLLLINSQNDVVLEKTYCAVLERKGWNKIFLNDLLPCLIRNNILRAGTFVIIYFNTNKMVNKIN